MNAQAKAHDSRYADFAARMLQATAEEEAFIAKFNALVTKHAPPVCDHTSETVRPSK